MKVGNWKWTEEVIILLVLFVNIAEGQEERRKEEEKMYAKWKVLSLHCEKNIWKPNSIFFPLPFSRRVFVLVTNYNQSNPIFRTLI